MSDKKTDDIVYNEKDGYIAKSLPYGSNTSAPAIKLEDVSSWKSLGANKVNKQFSAKFNQLKKEYHQLVEEYKWNDLVYKANFSFEPIIGETYHLYTGKDGSPFLSLIGPNEWLKEKDFLGTFILNSERKFEYVLQKE
tara:strand:+ start:46 stop:459 length:414 start_codon:yes stop_codon:yes gene_type:complete